MQTIGERIRGLRKQRNLSTGKLIELTGINSGSLSNYETEKYEPSAKAIIALSKALEVSTDWILTGTELGVKINTDEHALIEKLNELSDADRAETLEIIHAVIDIKRRLTQQ